MDRFIFFFLRYFRNVINRSGADFDQVQIIVANKLKMDNRKSINPNSNKKEPNYTLWIQYGMYLFFGMIMSAVIGSTNNTYTGFFIAYTFLIFMLAMNMIVDFSTVLLDTRDNTIIIPRPVSEKTYLLSRIIHIACYILGFSLAFSIVPFITIAIKYNGIAAFIFLLNALLSSMFSLFFTNLFYLSLMKITTGERFKDIISYFQIFITIFFFGGYQVIIRLIGKTNLFAVDTSRWWIYFVPSAWMAGSNEAFVSFEFTTYRFASIFLSLVIPITGTWLVAKVLAPGYANKLAILEQGDLKNTSKHLQEQKYSISSLLASIVTRTTTESTFFQIVWKIASRDRKFKQTVYPLLGGIGIFVFVIIFNQKESIQNLGTSFTFLMTLYVPLFYLFIIVSNLKYSDYYKAAWIYKVIPMQAPGEVVVATIKAITIKLFVPIYLLANGVFLYYRGIAFLEDIYSGLLFSLIIVIALLTISKVDLPFTANPADRAASGNMLLSFIMMPVGACMAGIHFLFYYFKIPILFLAIGLTIACWFVFKLFRKLSWQKIEAFVV